MTTHHLLQRQLDLLGIDRDALPDQGSWEALLEKVQETYQQTDTATERWKEAYSALREELTGAYENLRRSSAHLLRSERDKLQAVIESLGEGLCSLNENGCLLFMNPEAENLIGWQEAELRGQLALDWVMPAADDRTTTERLFNQIRNGEPAREENVTFLHCSGQRLPVSFVLNPIMRDGIFQGAVLTFQNITAFIQAQQERERKLKETMLLNRVIGATTSTLDLSAILETVCQELADFLNLPQAAFGILNEEKTKLTIIAEYLDEGRISALGEVIPVENNVATQTVLRCKQPLYIPDAQTDPRQAVIQDISRRRGTRSMLIVPLIVRGRVMGTLGLNAIELREFDEDEIALVQNVASAVSQVVDNAELYTEVQQELAERRAAEIALAQARDRALDASRLKSELIARVSHELRTPMTAILGFAEMLQLGIYGPVDPRQIEILDKVMQSTDGLVKLVNDLLDVAQLEAGRMHLNEIPFGVEDLVHRVEMTMRLLAEKKGLKLSCEIDPTLPSTLLGDPDRLFQILINLINNGVKFTRAGRIDVSIFLDPPSTWLIRVADTGIGIPAEMQSAIFDQFQQVRSGPTREHGGVGLGLSIVKQLVNLMGGTIEVQSSPGAGSAFTLSLPLLLPEAEPLPCETEAEQPAG